MRLVNTETLELKTFFDSQVPAYAILSHTWGDEEVDLQAFSRGDGRDSAGWKKIDDSCKLARRDEYAWAWVDDCCIDKTSSAELSEAINSMYRWYKQAGVCYAFLSDFDSEAQPLSHLTKCRWFTRGWTLQELLAPKNVEFYDRELRFLGDRKTFWFAQELSAITNIGAQYLLKLEPLESACVAERMFWASRRQTTRVEDVAYCLLGIFDVNMPLLYGEGQKAFIRLQEHIFAQSRDETLLAWTLSDSTAHLEQARGLFAVSVSEFARSGGLYWTAEGPTRRSASSTTTHGVEIPVAQFLSRWSPELVVPCPPTLLKVPLACTFTNGPSAGRRVVMRLRRPYVLEGLWTREPSRAHLVASGVNFFLYAEVLLAGYTKIHIASQNVANTMTKEEIRVRSEKNEPVWLHSILTALIALLYLTTLIPPLRSWQQYMTELDVSTNILFHWILLNFMWHLGRNNPWFVLIPFIFIAHAGLWCLGWLLYWTHAMNVVQMLGSSLTQLQIPLPGLLGLLAIPLLSLSVYFSKTW